MKYQIEYIDPKTIQPANYNPRGITDDAKEGLTYSIKKWGHVGPLVINRRNNNLVSGHQRLKISIEENLSEVPVIYGDWSEDEEKALNVTLNNQKISGYFTEELTNILEVIRNIPDIDPKLLKAEGLENHIVMDQWTTDLSRIEKVKEEIEQSKKRIFIDCPADLYDEVMIYIKGKLMETSFEGIHVR